MVAPNSWPTQIWRVNPWSAGGGAEVFDERVEGDDLVAGLSVSGVVEGEGGVAGAAQGATERVEHT